jgi:hypothetical protein
LNGGWPNWPEKIFGCLSIGVAMNRLHGVGSRRGLRSKRLTSFKHLEQNNQAQGRKVMNRFNFAADRLTGKDLERVVEPLAAYICATEQPKTALMSALAVLFREVEATNTAAASYFQSFMQN